MVAAALASVLLTGCGFLLFGERDTGEIVVDNRTDVPLTVTYRGRFVERVPAQSVHSMYPGPVEDGGCLIAPLVVRDESNAPVTQADTGDCFGRDRITLVIEQGDLP